MVSVSALANDSPKGKAWTTVSKLQGEWRGESTGFGQTSQVQHKWEFVLDNNFLRLTTISVTSNAIGQSEKHEDVGYISWSDSERVLRFHQFLSEGFVNTFIVKAAEPPEKGIDFIPEHTEGMPTLSVAMSLRFTPDSSYEMTLAMGKKGSDLKTCQTMKMTKFPE
ncbi:hypothetical protein HR45_06265 [Shewanella mangrovi]|uniref:THAP4-like heme-binding beta-barrel domain-containing protein n=1 Tax=Shewanella mangrovi TaxID=1515746 RepID=A0A094JJ84_9GAMM|nr:hypothetical protein [Shewanella mangrovi]KFZ38109.1 hypothetical protein HR45_06265 [Shewanella mangrovi]